jgi:hypothetical protein
MSEVDRLRAALAAQSAQHAALAGRIEAEDLAGALVELGRELIGEQGWRYVIGEKPTRRRPTRR